MDAAILNSLSLLEVMSLPEYTVPSVRDMKQSVAQQLVGEYIENPLNNVSLYHLLQDSINADNNGNTCNASVKLAVKTSQKNLKSSKLSIDCKIKSSA